MLFEFIKYISPNWYFNLVPASQSIPYFVDYRKLSKEEQALLTIDDQYKTLQGKLADAAYQAWHKGIIKKEPEYSLYVSCQCQKPGRQRIIELFEDNNVILKDNVFVNCIQDNYRFIRRFFNPAILWYILAVRLLSFRNPVTELCSFIKSLKIKRIDLYKKNAWGLVKNDYNQFDSEIISREAKVSVIIPTLNRYIYLKDVLSDLEKQDYKSFEVIICDQSDPYDENFYKNWRLDLKLIKQKEKALCLARNNAMLTANGEYLAFLDDDVRIDSAWMKEHLKCVDYFKADISAGVFYPKDLGIPEAKKAFKWGDQFATGNALIKKEVLRKTGLFDRQFEKQRGEDGEFGLRCFLAGYISISNPFASCKDVKAPTGGLREFSGWDSLRPKKILAPRPVPSLLYLSRKYFGNHFARLMLLFTIPGSIVPYKHKSKSWLKILAGASMIFLWPFLLLQVSLSWSMATKKLNMGPLIEKFNQSNST